MLKNPLPVQARGYIYIASIVLGMFCLVAAAVLTVLDMGQWTAVPAVIASSMAAGAGVLARDNLVDSTEELPHV